MPGRPTLTEREGAVTELSTARPADRRATELVFVVVTAAAAGEKCIGRGADLTARLMGGSAHSGCQSEPSYPLND